MHLGLFLKLELPRAHTPRAVYLRAVLHVFVDDLYLLTLSQLCA